MALELTPFAEFKPQKAAPGISFRQLTGRVTGLWRSLALILALSVALQVFVILAPFFMQWVVDQVLISADRDLLTVLGLGFGDVLPQTREGDSFVFHPNNGMQVIWQHHRGDDCMRYATGGLAPRFAQCFYFADQQVAPAVAQRDGEEVCCACNPTAAISDHGSRLPNAIRARPWVH